VSNNNYNALIELNSSESSAKNVFCLHSAGGGVEGYKWLAKHFSDKYKFYGLEDPYIFDNFDYGSMQEIARHHIKVIKSIQRSGTYILFGYCSGGPIAHEVGNQLRLIGEQVESATYFNRTLSWYDPKDETRFFFLKSYLSGKYNIKFDSVNWALCETKGIDFITSSVIDVFTSNGWEINDNDYGWIRKTIVALSLMKCAARNYIAPNVDFKVFQFTSQKDSFDPSSMPWCNFESHASSFNIPAPQFNEHDSNDLLMEPNVRLTIKKIEDLILK
jgi:hypothetical protein